MEKICVIKGATLGFNADTGRLTMSFAAYETESFAASQKIIGPELELAFSDTGAPDVQWFNGKTCWCECGGVNITYLRMFKST